MTPNRLTVWLLIGAPGSGKTTYGKTLVEQTPNTIRLCPDEFRAKFGWGEGDMSVSSKAFSETKKEMGKALDEGKHVIIDATNMYRKTRKDFINIARGRGARVCAVVFEIDKSTLLDRNKKRGECGGRDVPENIIDSMLQKYQRPDEIEFDKVTFVCHIKS